MNKDVIDENESKKTSVLMRIFILLLVFYLDAQLVAFVVFREFVPAVVSVMMVLCYTLAFIGTYKGKTKVAFAGIQILTLAWIVGSIYMLGWDCGIQQFLLIQLILALLCGFQKARVKIIMASVYLLIRIGLYIYSLGRVCMFPLTRQETIVLQTINSIAIYIQITFLIIIFAREAQAAERKLVLYNRKIKEMAFRDPLTRLRNRRSMLELLQETTREDSENRFICIAISDIDFFKKVNDTYGHEAGDEVLKAVSENLAEYMAHRGYVARWGGEEFLFLFHNGNGDEVMTELDLLRKRIGDMVISYEEKEIRVTMTFGLVEYNFNNTLEENISEADRKLYDGKTSGRNKVVF